MLIKQQEWVVRSISFYQYDVEFMPPLNPLGDRLQDPLKACITPRHFWIFLLCKKESQVWAVGKDSIQHPGKEDSTKKVT